MNLIKLVNMLFKNINDWINKSKLFNKSKPFVVSIIIVF